MQKNNCPEIIGNFYTILLYFVLTTTISQNVLR